MQVQNQKVERAHRALAAYLRPKLRRGTNIEFTSAFVGSDDRNIAQRIPAIVADVMRLTHNELAQDADVAVASEKMRKAIDDQTCEVDESVVNKLMALLEHKLLPTELMAVREILTQQGKPSAFDPGGSVAEDAALGFNQRFPHASKIKIEPTCAPEPQRQTPSADPDAFAKRFPNAMRIG
jgi:hypothetical protein